MMDEPNTVRYSVLFPHGEGRGHTIGRIEQRRVHFRDGWSGSADNVETDDGVALVTDGGEPEDEESEGVRVSGGAPDMAPFADRRSGYALTEIVREGEDAPEVTREFVGRDTDSDVQRQIALVRGGATREQERPIEFQVDEDRQHTRILVPDGDMAVDVLKKFLGGGEYHEK